MSIGIMTEEKFYTVKEVAALLRTTQRTIWKMIDSGELDAFTVGNAYRISERALEDYIQKSRKRKGQQKGE